MSHASSCDRPRHPAEGTWRCVMCDGGPPVEAPSYLVVQVDRSHPQNLKAWWRATGGWTEQVVKDVSDTAFTIQWSTRRGTVGRMQVYPSRRTSGLVESSLDGKHAPKWNVWVRCDASTEPTNLPRAESGEEAAPAETLAINGDDIFVIKGTIPFAAYYPDPDGWEAEECVSYKKYVDDDEDQSPHAQERLLDFVIGKADGAGGWFLCNHWDAAYSGTQRPGAVGVPMQGWTKCDTPVGFIPRLLSRAEFVHEFGSGGPAFASLRKQNCDGGQPLFEQSLESRSRSRRSGRARRREQRFRDNLRRYRSPDIFGDDAESSILG